MRYTYTVRQDLIKNEDEKETPVFGIDTFDESGRLVASLPDIFTNKERTERLAQLCTEQDLDAVHLKDVVEDMLE